MSPILFPSSGPRLLILGCSQRKRSGPGLLPALERYDGPAYRVLRRWLASPEGPCPRVLVLSAEFGLITADHPLPWYDRRLDRRRSAELEPRTTEALRAELGVCCWQSVFLYLGRDYLRALGGPESFRSAPANEVLLAQGPPGVRLSQLRSWLCQEPSPAGCRWHPRKLP